MFFEGAEGITNFESTINMVAGASSEIGRQVALPVGCKLNNVDVTVWWRDVTCLRGD